MKGAQLELGPNCEVVRLAGIEPTTPWFVAKYSIQLSYSRNSHNYAMEEKNYITPAGHDRIKKELLQLLNHDRPEIVKVVHWAASNGDRSENGDYIYGKKRLREIDRRIRFLNQRLEFAVVVDNLARKSGEADAEQVFFGATVTYAPTLGSDSGKKTIITIVGVDEVDLELGHVSWVSPIAKALIKARLGDCVIIQTPSGPTEIEILDVRYL
jgi:transcription elongation factor GreB